MQLEELYRIKRVLEEERDEFLRTNGHTGDQTYQDLLNDLERIDEEIEEIETT